MKFEKTNKFKRSPVPSDIKFWKVPNSNIIQQIQSLKTQRSRILKEIKSLKMFKFLKDSNSQETSSFKKLLVTKFSKVKAIPYSKSFQIERDYEFNEITRSKIVWAPLDFNFKDIQISISLQMKGIAYKAC